MKQRSTQRDVKVKRKYRSVSYNGSRGKVLQEKTANGRFSAAQTKRLLAFFEMNTCPDNQQKQELAGELDMEVLQVSTWFSNRRSRLRRAALKKSLAQERANATTSAFYSSHPVTMTEDEKPCQSAQAFGLSASSESLVPLCRNSGFSLSHGINSIPHSQVVDDVISIQCRRTRFVPTSPLLAIPLTCQQEFEHSAFNPTQCLRYCDQLLQKMFGQDWIDKVNTRQN